MQIFWCFPLKLKENIFCYLELKHKISHSFTFNFCSSLDTNLSDSWGASTNNFAMFCLPDVFWKKYTRYKWKLDDSMESRESKKEQSWYQELVS